MNEWRKCVPADLAQLPVLMQFLQEFWSAASLPPAQAMNFEVALEELFINVVTHGSSVTTAPRVELSLVLAAGDVRLTIEDDGAEFDPLTLPEPNLAASLSERPIGGLGVFLVRKLMDTVSYARIGSTNRLRISKRVARPREDASPSATGPTANLPRE